MHERDWLGPLAAFTHDAEPVSYYAGQRQAKRQPVGHRFDRGWLGRVEFHNLTVNQARALANTPDARLLRELVVETIEAETPAGTNEQYVDSYYDPGPDVPPDIDSYDAPGFARPVPVSAPRQRPRVPAR